jgi:hypothetical protein
MSCISGEGYALLRVISLFLRVEGVENTTLLKVGGGKT